MKIGFTGGGSGGHFYPIIAVAQKIQEHVHDGRILEPQLFYFAPKYYDRKALFDLNIRFVPIKAGKIRPYFSVRNFFDIFVTTWGIFRALWRILVIFPDVIFSTGSYVSFPVLFAARIFRIPVIIHENDASPGKANIWASKFAKKIGLSFPDASEHFDKKFSKKIAFIGHPVRKDVLLPTDKGAHEYLNLEKTLPVILVLGGSQGAKVLNEAILDTFPDILEHFQIIHQTGPKHLDEIQNLASVYLEESEYSSRYKPFGSLNTLAIRMAAGAADIIVSRAGAGAIFEIAAWGKPSIVVPIGDNSHNQRANAFAFARSGATDVIEEHNLTPNLLVSEINRLMNDQAKRKQMSIAARNFYTPDTADKIAREILDLALEHEA